MPMATQQEMSLLQDTLADACRRLSKRGETVNYLGSVLLASDQRLLSWFEAATAESVRTANENAQAPFVTLQLAIELPSPTK